MYVELTNFLYNIHEVLASLFLGLIWFWTGFMFGRKSK